MLSLVSYRLIICDRATQDLRQQANYILVNSNAHAAEQFLELAEVTFAFAQSGLTHSPP